MSMKDSVFWLLLASLVVLALCELDKDPCTLDTSHGPCKENKKKWFYSRTSGKCETFNYGGCKGNGNRFNNEKECIQACVCTRPAFTGPCNAAIIRYHYDKGTKRCEKFVYGGCNGNKNNFEDLDECSKTCGGKKIDKPNQRPTTTKRKKGKGKA